MWHYENLNDIELQRVANSVFGDVLKPIDEIGRDAVIDELKKYDEFKLKTA